jgi:hypothetical protein
MTVVVGRIAVVARAVDAVNVVAPAVAVIVDPVPGDLARVRPQVLRQIRVMKVDAGVDHGDDDAGRARGRLSRGRRIDRPHVPLRSPAGVVGSDVLGGDEVVGLRVADALPATECPRPRRRVPGDVDDEEASGRLKLLDVAAVLPHQTAYDRALAGVDTHEDAARFVPR